MYVLFKLNLDINMTKSITVYFENEEFKLLKEKKLKLSWHDFIMALVKKDSVKATLSINKKVK